MRTKSGKGENATRTGARKAPENKPRTLSSVKAEQPFSKRANGNCPRFHTRISLPYSAWRNTRYRVHVRSCRGMGMTYPRKLVVGGLYLSASCSLRGTLAFHLISSSTTTASRRTTVVLHKGNIPNTAGTCISPNHHVSPPAPTNTVAFTPYHQRSQHHRQQCRRFGSSMTHLSMSSTTMIGQDSGEMFDVYLAPVPSVEGHTGPPKSAGFSKARKLVHKDGDWHRSVHIWLHNAKVCCLLCAHILCTVFKA